MTHTMELTPSRSPHADAAATPRKSFALLQSPFEPVQPATERASSMDPPPETKLDDAPANADGQAAAAKPAAPPAAAKILFLDGLRGLAAMAVIMQHAKWMGVPVGQPAVDMFFVLSAFLLTMIFERKARTLLAEKANWRRWAYALVDYFVRRFLRVYPLFFVITLIIWALPQDLKERYFVFSHPEQFNVLKTLVFEFDFRYHVFWTLPLEIMYYFLIPVFVLVVLLLRKLWFLPMIPLAYLIAYSGFYWTRGDHMALKPHLPTFLCGSMAAIIYAKIEQFMTKRKLVFRWYSWLVLRAIEMWCLLLLFSTLFNGLLFSWVFTNPIEQTPGGRFVSSNISVIIVCELLLPGVVSELLEWSLLRYAGKVSYSMYLLHSFVVYTPWIDEQKWYDRYFAIWALAFLLSAASYHAIEYPCQWFAAKVGKAIKAKDMIEKKRLAEERARETAMPQTPQPHQQPQPEPATMV